ncbi:P-loop NTPase fold protein [Sorangium sp. So ce295]|uniref:P-loop NTPase fold protein n=1 Tax=Sorangium sp. So ce295 TaxID=3133295 RepID=UPI003F5ECD5A
MLAAEDVLRELIAELKSTNVTQINEAATRLRFIDRILAEVLGWPRSQLNPETYVGQVKEKQWLDYHLVAGESSRLVVEAKRLGKTFNFEPKKRTRRVSLQSLRTAHSPALGTVIKQATGYCQKTGTINFVVTNGTQWIASIASWPNIPESKIDALVFHDLDEILGNLREFVEALGPDAIIRGTLIEKAIQGPSLLPPFARSVNMTFANNPPQTKNYLARPLETLMLLCFDDLTGTEREQMLEFCYVTNDLTDSYVARLESFVGQTMPHNLRDANYIDRTKSGKGKKRPPEVFSSGESVLLIGKVGSGKTSFIEYAINKLRSQFDGDEWVLLHLSLIYKTQGAARAFDHDSLRNELCDSLLKQAHEMYPDLSPYKFENLKGIFSQEIQRARAAMPPSMRAKASSEDQEYAITEAHRSDSYKHLMRYVQYLVSNRNIRVTIVVDNIDRTTPEFEQMVVLFARGITNETGATTITAMRDTTYHNAIRGGFLDVGHNTPFFISPPPFISVVARRIDYSRKLLDGSGVAVAKIRRNLGGHPFERVQDFLEVLAEITLNDNRDISDAIQALSGTDVRTGLGLLRSFVISGNTDVEQFMKDYNRSYFQQPLEVFIRSVMRGNVSRYVEKDSRIANIFQAHPKVLRSHFAAVRVLQYLRSRVDQIRVEVDAPVETVVAAVAILGNSPATVKEVLNHLGRYRLILSRTRPEPPWDDGDEVRIGSAGQYYLSTLITSREYIRWITDDTVIYDPDTLDNMVWLHDNGSITWKERYEHKVRSFLLYLLTRERDELMRAGPVNARPAWLAPVVEDICVRFWGVKYAAELRGALKRANR